MKSFVGVGIWRQIWSFFLCLHLLKFPLQSVHHFWLLGCQVRSWPRCRCRCRCRCWGGGGSLLLHLAAGRLTLAVPGVPDGEAPPLLDPDIALQKVVVPLLWRSWCWCWCRGRGRWWPGGRLLHTGLLAHLHTLGGPSSESQVTILWTQRTFQGHYLSFCLILSTDTAPVIPSVVSPASILPFPLVTNFLRFNFSWSESTAEAELMLINPGPGLGGLGAEDKLAFFRTYTSPLITISSSNLGC